MRRTLVCLVTLGLVLHGAAARAQLPPQTAGPVDSIAWEYADSGIASAAVDRFEATFDKLPAVKVPLTARVTGTDTYKTALPPLTPGLHTVSVVACNVSTCSAPATLDFQLVVVPPAVVNLHTAKGS